MTEGVAGARMALGPSHRTAPPPSGDEGGGRETGFATLLDEASQAAAGEQLRDSVPDDEAETAAGPEMDEDLAGAAIAIPACISDPTAGRGEPAASRAGSRGSGAGAESGLSAAVMAKAGAVTPGRVTPGPWSGTEVTGTALSGGAQRLAGDAPPAAVTAGLDDPETFADAVGKETGWPFPNAAKDGQAGGETAESSEASRPVVHPEDRVSRVDGITAERARETRPTVPEGAADAASFKAPRSVAQDQGAAQPDARPEQNGPAAPPDAAKTSASASPPAASAAPTERTAQPSQVLAQEERPRAPGPDRTTPADDVRPDPEAGPPPTRQERLSGQDPANRGKPIARRTEDNGCFSAYQGAATEATRKGAQAGQDRLAATGGEIRPPERDLGPPPVGPSGTIESPMIRPNEAADVRPPAASEGGPTVRRIGRQIAAHPVLRAGGRAELSLAPEELGHLRLSVEMGETGLRVVIEAARPETADLMRRHVEALRLELRQEGLGQVGVSISGGNSQPGRETPHSAGHGSERRAGAAGPVAPDQAQPPSNIPATRARGAGGSLDLRF